MGCLVEFIFEVVIEIFGEGYFWLMRQIVPNHTFSKKTEKLLKTVVSVFTAIVFLAIILGIILIIQENENEIRIGKYVLSTALTVSILQIALGIIVKMKTKNKNSK